MLILIVVLLGFLCFAKQKIENTFSTPDSTLTEYSILHELPFFRPLDSDSGKIIRRFGPSKHPDTGKWYLNLGLDFESDTTLDVFSTADGKIHKIYLYESSDEKYDSFYDGFVVELRHKYGFFTRYAGLSSIKLTTGDEIEQGDLIGKLALNQKQEKYILHYEVLLGTKVIDPLPFFKKE